MSIFQINTNSTATNALYNINQTSNSLSTSIQRLSTGLRINSAADDPSGLIEAKQFQAQITGINQAISNSQDAINYSKTADGALNEVNNLLNTARGLAVAASNTGDLSSSQVAADNNQLQSIISSINTIAGTTEYGTKHLLDGSSGVTAGLTNGANVSSVSLSGSIGGTAIAANAAATITVTTAATKATSTLSVAALTAGTLAGPDQFTLNGVSFNTSASNTVQDALNAFNQASGQTGVTATLTGGSVVLTSVKYGANAKINFTDSTGKLNAGSATSAGVNAIATLAVGTATSTLTGGSGTNDGLTLSDTSGNTVVLTGAGNAVVGGQAAAQVSVGTAQFQIGGNVGQTTTLSIGNFNAGALGTGAVAGANLGNIDLSNSTDASNALQVIDQSISQVTSARGSIGSFQSNILQPNLDSLNVASQNLSSSLSNIQDTNVAAEITNYTQLQILQSAGLSVLAQANAAPQSVLKLLP